MIYVGYIYKTTNLVNGKIYIGQHQRQEFDDRYYGSGKIIQQALAKYGLQNFKVEVLYWAKKMERLNEAEILFIEAFNSTDLTVGYNISFGGSASMYKLHHTDETKKRIGAASKNRIVSDITKEKMRLAQKGRGAGRKLPEEVKEKIKASNSGHIVTEETRRKISASHFGMKASEESVEKNRKGHLGKIPWNKGTTGLKGHPISPELQARLKEVNTGRVHTIEERHKISQMKKGKPWSEARRNALKNKDEILALEEAV